MTEKELERVYKAIANRRRIMIVRHLRSVRLSTVGDIAGAIKLSYKATSRHLQVLAGAGYVIGDLQGPYMHYSLKPQSEIVKSVIRAM